MTFSTEIFDREAAALRAFAGRDLDALSVHEFADLREAVARTKRSFDALVASVAGQAARRSTPDMGHSGLARTEGHHSPEGLIAGDLGLSPGEAAKLVRVGTAMSQSDERARRDADGDAQSEGGADLGLPQAPTHPHVTRAVKAGLLSIEEAALITRTIDAIDPTDPNAGDLDDLERQLVAKAQRMTLKDLRAMCRRQEAFRSPRDLERKERAQRQARYLAFSEDPTGMFTMHGKMDPATAAPIRAWVDAQVKAALRRRRDEPGADERDAGQMRIDALAMLAQHGLDCDHPTSGVKTTVVVRVDMADLERGIGVADCDSLAQPISVPTLRAMAVDAAVVPVMLGGDTLPLDVGRDERYFTPAQRIALAERDGGCAWCHAPPSYCEAHHIEWWVRDRGTSDLRNGVLLCTSCHHRIHEADWRITVRGGEVWFTPPRGVDPQQRPRLGGNAHLDALHA